MDTIDSLNGRKEIRRRISNLEESYMEKETSRLELATNPIVGEYLGLEAECEGKKHEIDLLKKGLIMSCNHVIFSWKDENGQLHFCCAADCGYDEKSPYFETEASSGKLLNAIIPHTFKSREEGIRLYEMAIRYEPINDPRVIIRTMLKLMDNPIIEYGGRQKIALRPAIATTE